MTDRLYYQDAYMQAFDAVVTAAQARCDGHWLALDRSAFYPTSGGQPHDTGTLSADGVQARVLDVQAGADGEVWHRTDRPLAQGARVRGRIDWARRFDHMQQHAGEHILAGCLATLYQGHTHGLHVAQDYASIDVTLPGGVTRLSPEAIDQLELLANQRVQLDAPIRAWFPTQEELKNIRLRKEPAVSDHIRVVEAGDFEACACGGTHPSSTGQVGLIKVLDTLPSRGKMRVVFLCGERATRHYQALYRAAGEAGALLSCPVHELSAAVGRLQQEIAQQKESIRALRLERAQALAGRLAAEALPLSGGARLVRACLPGLDMDDLKEIAALLVRQAGLTALLAAPKGEGHHLLFARHEAGGQDMAALLRSSGGRGGGRPDFAQGSAPDARALDQAAEALGLPQGMGA